MPYSPAAFGLGTFKLEKDLESTPLIQRPRKLSEGRIDFVERGHVGPTLSVELVGGPYDKQVGVCHPNATHLWVVGDYSYRKQSDGRFHWHYDSYA